MQFIVIEAHCNEFPAPITFVEGTSLTVGEVYQGDEGWDDWYFCEAAGQQGGWVPGQVIELLAPGEGVALQDYTAQELDVVEGESVSGGRHLNGWVWCTRAVARAGLPTSGWVPLRNLRSVGP
ncbi:SH3 domain-containing protein [Pseudomonas wadenswilerensis]